jgi:hypothetical protein
MVVREEPEGSSGVVQCLPRFGVWQETRTDQLSFSFEKVARNDKFVELRDTTRNVLVRLYDDRMDSKVADNDWKSGERG